MDDGNLDALERSIRRQQEAYARLLPLAREKVGWPIQVGSKVRMLVEMIGDDHESVTHTLPAGTIATVDSIDDFGEAHGISITVVAPVDPGDADVKSDTSRFVANMFDEQDEGGYGAHFVPHEEAAFG